MTTETYRCFECEEHSCEFVIYTRDDFPSGGSWYNLRCPMGWRAIWKKKNVTQKDVDKLVHKIINKE